MKFTGKIARHDGSHDAYVIGRTLNYASSHIGTSKKGFDVAVAGIVATLV